MPSTLNGPTLTYALRVEATQLYEAWAAYLNIEAANAENMMLKAVGNWKGKPKFSIKLSEQTKERIQSGVEVKGDDAPKWFWIDKGTGLDGPKGQSYVITPKAPGYPLRFQAGYSPKTAPIAKANVGNGSRSGPTIRTYLVMHPGITARKFVQTWAEERLQAFRANIVKTSRVAMRKAINKL